jgi:peptidoglycan/LPS O-acetylase OafA/YrhL
MNRLATTVNPSRAFNIPSLDGIRALAFLFVFVSHDNIKQVPGLFGVGVFFFLSGYLITTLLRIENERTGTVSIKDFYLRRAFRILPPFYLTLLLILLVVKASVLPGHLGGADLLATVFYLTNYWNIYVHGITMPGFNIFWSLAVEEHFYLLFPFLMLFMIRFKLKRRTQAIVLLALCALVLAWRFILVYHLHSLTMTFGSLDEPLRTMFATDTRVDSILFGCVLALWGNPVLDQTRKPGWLLIGASVIILLVTLLYRTPEFRETLRYTLQGIAFMPLFSAAITLHEHWVFAWLNSRIMRFLGVLSYTLYLVHYPSLVFMQRWFHSRLLVGVTALAASIALAYVIHILVERPLARLRRHFGSRTAEVIEKSTVELAPAG